MGRAARPRLLFDATRLITRATFATPTGIDRVDLVYARTLRMSQEFDTSLIVFDRFGPYRLRDRAADRLLASIAARWQASAGAQTRAFGTIADWLESGPNTDSNSSAPRAAHFSGIPKPDLASLRRVLGRRMQSIGRTGVHQAIYVNTSHGRLHHPSVARWLGSNALPGVYFVHDLIPIEYPEYNRVHEPLRHEARLRLISAKAGLVIANSEATRESLVRWLSAQRLRIPRIRVIPLGVSEAFLSGETAPTLRAATPYFVILGTIEPRKNHALLLRIWRQLSADLGAAAPRLVIVGRRGWENETSFKLIDDTPSLRATVAEVRDLGDAEVAVLLRGARALLAPSFAEGYDLPIVEALACGTPVIASNLAAHREVGGTRIKFLDPLDGPGWRQLIQTMAADGTQARAPASASCVPTWETHAQAALAAIREVLRSLPKPPVVLGSDSGT